MDKNQVVLYYRWSKNCTEIERRPQSFAKSMSPVEVLIRIFDEIRNLNSSNHIAGLMRFDFFEMKMRMYLIVKFKTTRYTDGNNCEEIGRVPKSLFHESFSCLTKEWIPLIKFTGCMHCKTR